MLNSETRQLTGPSLQALQLRTILISKFTACRLINLTLCVWSSIVGREPGFSLHKYAILISICFGVLPVKQAAGGAVFIFIHP